MNTEIQSVSGKFTIHLGYNEKTFATADTKKQLLERVTDLADGQHVYCRIEDTLGNCSHYRVTDNSYRRVAFY